MKKRIFAVTVGVVAILLGILFFLYDRGPETYSTAKKDCEKFLAANAASMEKIAADLMNAGKEDSGYYREHYYSYRPTADYVEFQIDGQGMLGGQDWRLVYTKDGRYGGEAETFFHREDGGNNIVKAEKLAGNWWYLWIDYDGTDRSNQ